jgi:hypothetical protein
MKEPGAMKRPKAWRTACLFCACLALAACAVKTPEKPDGGIADLRHFPQDLRIYAERAGRDASLLDAASQAAHWQRYRRLLFGPWEAKKASVTRQEAFAELKSPGYAENLLPRSAKAHNALLRTANQATYPNRLLRGVTVRATALRAAPTMLPRFNNPLDAGEGYPFDTWQYATLPLGMPVLMTHASADGAWMFVETALLPGWVAARDLAEADAAFRERYRQLPLGAVLRDKTSLSVAGKVAAGADIGTLLPLVGTGAGSGNRVLVPLRDAWGKAQIVIADVEAGAVRIAPLPLTPGTLSAVGNEFLGQTYGWGGLYGHRDCSSMLRDVFTPFGVWLPRNSSAQARSWEFAPLPSLPAGEKEAHILRRARPFATLLWLPGHIALYLGEYEGRAAIFHDIWGIRTFADGREGRYVLGRTLISGLQPGLELPDAQPGQDLLTRMKGMTILR